MKLYSLHLFIFSLCLSANSIAQTFDKSYDETFFNEIEIQSDGYTLHQVPYTTNQIKYTDKRIKTDLSANLLSIETDSFPLPNQGDSNYQTNPLIHDPSIPFPNYTFSQILVSKVESISNQVIWQTPVDLLDTVDRQSLTFGHGPSYRFFEGEKSSFMFTYMSAGSRCCNNNFHLTKIDESGNIVYTKNLDDWPSIGNGLIYNASLAFEADDGSTYFSTNGIPPAGTLSLNKWDAQSNLVWKKPIKDFRPDASGVSGLELSDGNLLLVFSKPNGFYAIKTTPDGDELQSFEYNANQASLRDFKETPDGGIVFLGDKNPSGIFGENKTFFVKIDSNFTTTLDQKIDLQLSATKSGSPYKIYTPFQYELTVSNTSNIAATNIVIDVPQPAEAIYQGGNEYTTTDGTFTTWGDNVWRIDNLPKGESATLTINYFLMTEDNFHCYAQVTNVDEPDEDSTPDNGTCCQTANEDDESALGIFPFKTLPDLTIKDLDMPGYGDLGSVVNYTISLRNSGNAAALGDFTMGIYLSDDNQVSADDRRVGWINTGNFQAGFRQNVPGAITLPDDIDPGFYNLILVIDENEEITEIYETNNTLRSGITIEAPDDPRVNLSLRLIPWTGTVNVNTPFVTTIHLDHYNSNQLATNVNVALEVSSDDVELHPGGGAISLTQGDFDEDNMVWEVGDIPPGETATLQINWLRTGADEINFFGQVIAQDQTDWNSTPNNGICCTRMEDDEVNFTLPAQILSVDERNLIWGTTDQLAIKNVYPSPAFDIVRVQIFAPQEQETEIQVFDLLGKMVQSRKVELSSGNNEIPLDISSLPSGKYSIIMHPFHPHFRKGTFMKLSD